MSHAGDVSWVGEVGRVNDGRLPGVSGHHLQATFALRVEACRQEHKSLCTLVLHPGEHLLKVLWAKRKMENCLRIYVQNTKNCHHSKNLPEPLMGCG